MMPRRNGWLAALLMLALVAVASQVALAAAKPGPDDKDAPKEFSETKSGLKYRILRKSNGKKPTVRDTVSVHYKGWLDNGKEFDSSYSRGKPTTFPLNGVIPGWTEGLQLVGEGGKIELLIPSRLGYGRRICRRHSPRRHPAFHRRTEQSGVRRHFEKFSRMHGGHTMRKMNPAWAALLALALVALAARPGLGVTQPGPDDKDAPQEFSGTKTGLKYRILRKSGGRKPTAADSVTVHYKGWLDNGKEFDNSYKRDEPTSFALSEVVAGWTEGLQLIGEGGKIELLIPSHIGYGPRGMSAGGIPGNATLHFIVELIRVK